MSPNTPILAAESLAFAYNSELVIKDTAFSIPRGAFVIVKGPSGGGKSTILRLLARFEAPNAGTLRLEGTEYADIPPHEFRLRVGFMHQKPVNAPGSIRDNLALAFAYRKGAAMPDDDTLITRLAQIQLSDVSLDQPASELSVGQQQRVAFLRLVLFDSDVLLLDEPLASLDEESAGRVMDELHACNKAGKTIILSAHGNNMRRTDGMSFLYVDNNTARFEP